MVKEAVAGKQGEYQMVLTNPPFGEEQRQHRERSRRRREAIARRPLRRRLPFQVSSDLCKLSQGNLARCFAAAITVARRGRWTTLARSRQFDGGSKRI